MKKTIALFILMGLTNFYFSQSGSLLLRSAGNAISYIQDSRIRFATDLEGNGNDYKGINNGTVTGCSFTPGQGVTFNGTSDYIQYSPSFSSFSLTVSSFEISFFIKTTTTLTTFIFGNSSSTGTVNSRGISARIQAGIIYCAIYQSSGAFIGAELNTVTTINDGNWHHVLFRRTGSVLSLYVDNVFKSQSTGASGGVRTSSNNFCLGRLGDYAAGGYFAGSIKCFSIIANVNPSFGDVSDIEYLYNAGNGCNPPFNGK